jgi:Tfp pilus assembly protein PilF
MREMNARWNIRLIGMLMLSIVLAVGATGCSSSSSHKSSPSTTINGANANTAAVQTLLQEGIRQAEAKMFDQATVTFNNVLTLSPNNVFALYNLGVIEQTQNNNAGALAYYNRALNADGTYTPAMYNKAILLEPTDRNAALALYKQIVAINPKASTAYLRMAFIYAKQGQTVLANAARAKAISLDPSLAKYPLPPACSQPNC